MATKVKEPELTQEETTQAAEVLPVESPLVYLEARCLQCGTMPIKRQGGPALLVTCGRCGKVIES